MLGGVALARALLCCLFSLPLLPATTTLLCVALLFQEACVRKVLP